MRRFLFVLSIIALAGPGVALAQSAPAQPPGPPPGQHWGGPPGQGGHWHHGWGHRSPWMSMAGWKLRFDTANTTHDGHLTLAQAKAAGLRPVVDHFSEIDVNKRGYVTFDDLLAWHLDKAAQRLEQQAAELRAQG